MELLHRLRMLPEIELDVLLFLDRDTLDVYQLSSAKSDQTIQRNADVLAVRVINLLQVVGGISVPIVYSF